MTVSTSTSGRRATAHHPDLSPPARRASRPGWRDPRLAVGIALVALSVVVGVRVVDGRDDTTPVLAAARPLVPGQTIGASDLVTVDVRFEDASSADRYLASSSTVRGAVVTRPVAAGEMVPRAATSGSAEPQARLPLAVPLGQVPSTVSQGSVVDVWASSGGEGVGTDGGSSSRRLLRAVPVVAMNRTHGLGPDSEIRVVVGVPDDERTAGRAVRALAGASVTLVHRPDGS